MLLWPQRRSGFPLGYDLVFTPRQNLGAATLGVSSTPPRAVPVDALVALAEHLVNGAVVGRAALVLPLLLAGLGAQRLLADACLPARLLAGGIAVWNPYVVERLALGQWALLWGYAALPWLLLVGSRHRRREAPLTALVLPLAAASITPTGGLLALLTVVAVTWWPHEGATWAARLRTLGVAVALQAPWLVAAALGGAHTTSDPASAAAFAARSELGGLAGLVPTLLSGGGVWSASVAPVSRGTVLVLVTAALLLWAGHVARHRLRELLGDTLAPLLTLSALGFVVALSSAVPGLDVVARHVVGQVAGGGLLRDSQKWIAPLVVLGAVVLGAAVDALVRRGPGALALGAIALGAVLVPLVLLPDATRVVWPTLTPVNYPAGFARVDRLSGDHDGSVLVLPFQSYRELPWTGERVVLDPAPRLLRADVVVSDRLQVGDRLLAGEDPVADRVAAQLARPDAPRALARDGIGWVLVEHGTPGTLPSLAGLRPAYDDADLTLYRVPGVTLRPPSGSRVAVALATTVAWLVAVLGCLVLAACSARARRRTRGGRPVDPRRGG